MFFAHSLPLPTPPPATKKEKKVAGVALGELPGSSGQASHPELCLASLLLRDRKSLPARVTFIRARGSHHGMKGLGSLVGASGRQFVELDPSP